LSSAPVVLTHNSSSSSSNSQSLSPRSSTAQQTAASLPNDTPISESYIDSLPPEQPQSSFTTALAMLLYDVSYLAWTQNVEVPLSQVGDVLSNLWSVCCSSDLGRYVLLLLSQTQRLDNKVAPRLESHMRPHRSCLRQLPFYFLWTLHSFYRRRALVLPPVHGHLGLPYHPLRALAGLVRGRAGGKPFLGMVHWCQRKSMKKLKMIGI
jgi:hypothetical protein